MKLSLYPWGKGNFSNTEQSQRHGQRHSPGLAAAGSTEQTRVIAVGQYWLVSPVPSLPTACLSALLARRSPARDGVLPAVSGLVALGTRAYVSVHRHITSKAVTEYVPAVLGVRKFTQ